MKKFLFVQLSQEILMLVVETDWKNDITNSVGQELDSLTSSAGYSQIIDKPIHIVNNSMSCIDLIFCTNANVIFKHGVDVSIFEKCHHNIIFGKIEISVPLPPAYVREVWDYSKANAENIKKEISSFNWNKTFKKLFRNYIPNKKIKCDYRQPPWMNDNIKRKLKQRTKLIKYFYKNGQMKCDYYKILEKSP